MSSGRGDHAADCRCIDCLIARSSVGQGLADIKRRGIEAHLRDLELESRPRCRRR